MKESLALSLLVNVKEVTLFKDVQGCFYPQASIDVAKRCKESMHNLTSMARRNYTYLTTENQSTMFFLYELSEEKVTFLSHFLASFPTYIQFDYGLINVDSLLITGIN